MCTVLVYWGHIWWWWHLQLLEAAGHRFFESCSGAARQLPWVVYQLLLNVWRYVHVMNAFIKANSALPSSAAAVRFAQLDRSCAAVTASCLTTFQYVCVSETLSKKRELWIVHRRPGNLFDKQFDVCVFKRFPKQTLYYTNSLKYFDWALERWKKRCQKMNIRPTDVAKVGSYRQ